MKRYVVVIVALVISMFIYHFYRTDHILLNKLWEEILGPPSKISSLLPALPDWVIYSLPEALWVLAASILALGLYLPLGNTRLPLALLPMTFALSLEVMQLLHVTDGVFDMTDVVFALMGCGVAYLFFDKTTLPYISKRFGFFLVLCSYMILILADVV